MMTTRPDVSVVIPTFNRRIMVMEAIESALSQQDVTSEVIVVDDGSTDETWRSLSRLQAPITIIRNERRLGVSAARNRGVALTTAPWIAFLDSDDLWHPQKLQNQLAYFKSHPSMLIAQTEEVWLYRGKLRNPKHYHAKPRGFCFSRLLDRCLISPSAVMLHRSLWNEVGGFDESLPACEDYDLWLRIGCRHPIGLIPKPLVVKRGGHPDQLSTTTPALDRYRIRAISALLRSGRLTPGQAQAALQKLREKCRIYGAGCLKRGRHEEAAVIEALPEVLASELADLNPESVT